MAVTSLAEQLSRLRVPQTSQLVDKKKKSSFLFHSREAADIDRDTFYSIGIDGLSELISINKSVFEQFSNSLFDVASKNFSRSIEKSETNEKLNEEIKSFLISCSPYFLLKPTAQALEWLISRYQVNEYNIDSLLMLALPYYETKLFPRLLQLLDLKSQPFWEWLQPVKEEGTPLSKTALFNRASSDMAFFKFVLNMPKIAIEYYSGNPEQLSNVFAFFCTTTIGALKQTAKINELQVTHLLPAIKSGMQSKVDDYTASVYMIVSFLVSKTRLSEMVVTQLLFRVVKVFKKKRLINESTLLMIVLCQCNAQFSNECLTIVLECEKEFLKSLRDTADRGISTFHVIRAIFNSYLSLNQKKSNKLSECQNLVIQILDNIKFSKEEAEEVFRLFINKCRDQNKEQRKKVEFLVTQLRTLERQYPDAFDTIVSDPKYSKTAKALFSLTPAYMGQMSLFNDLRNPNAAVRANAVKSVEKNFEPRESTWLSEVISERLVDESPLVVIATLKLNTDYLVSLLTKQRLVEHLMEAALKIWRLNSTKWSKVVPLLLGQFGRALGQGTELRTERNVLLTIVPYLLSGDISATRVVVSSPLSDQIPFLNRIKNNLKNIDYNGDADLIVSTVWEVLQDQSSLPSLDVVLQFENLKFEVEKSLAILMAASSIVVEIDPTKSICVLEWLWDLIKEDQLCLSESNVSEVTLGKIMNEPKTGRIPLALVHHLIIKLVKCTKMEVPHECQGWYKFENPSQRFLLTIFKICSQIHQTMGSNYLKVFNNIAKQLLKDRLTKKEYDTLLCSMIMESKDVSEFCLLLLHNQLKRELSKDKEDRLWTIELSPSNLLIPVLLITLSSPNPEIREQALSMIDVINSQFDAKATPYSNFLKQLVSWREEMTVDCEQLHIALYMLLSPDPTVESGLHKSVKQNMQNVRELLFDMITDPSTPTVVTSSLLSVLSHVTSTLIMSRLISIGIKIFDKHSANANGVIDENENAILKFILERIEKSIVSVFETEESWTFVEKCLSMSKNDPDSPPVIFLNKITREFFDDLPVTAKTKLIDQVVKIIAEAEISEMHSVASAMVKRISIDASTMLNILHAMRDAQQATTPGQRAKRRWSQTPNYLLLGTNDWKRGVCLLELIQNKKKLTDSYRLIAPLFDILKICLRFEEQGPVEYTKQLLLSTILHCLRKSAEEDKLKMLSPSALPVESIVDCIRVSQNPQTHHHALSVLSLVAGLKPEEVLHNVMAVFTFMGSSVIRLDDAYSFQVTLKTVETIIPILVQSVDTGKANRDQIKEVLQVFATAVLDIPEHRRLTLVHKLLITLDKDGGYLWLFICQVLASSVLEPEPKPPNSADIAQRKIKTLQHLCLEFSPSSILQAMHSIMKHVTSLPHEKENAKKSFDNRYPKKTSPTKDMDNLMVFDVERNSGKQLRHYKYNLLNFISGLFSAEQFVSMMVIYNNGKMNDDDRESLLLCFQQLVEGILGYMKEVSTQVDLTVNQPSARYWKAMLNLIYDLLSKTNALLPSEMFLAVVGSLLPHKIPKMRRRVMELLNWQLQSSVPLAPDGLRSLLPTLLTIVGDKKTVASQESFLNRQTALISIKLLARKIAKIYPDDFQEALGLLTKIVQEGSGCETNEEMAVTACAILCVAELLSSIGFKAIVQLPKFMPALISILCSTSARPNVPEFLLTSVITTLLKILEYHSNFISPYLNDILVEVALISAKFEKQTDSKSNVINVKMNSVLTNISEKVPMRILVPAIESSYMDLLEKRKFAALPVVLSVLSNSSQEQHHLKSSIQSFLMKVLYFRNENSDAAANYLLAVEKATISCVTAHVLKLNEKEFFSFCRELAMKTSTVLKMITMFKVLQTLSETLKSLFVPFSKEFQSKVIDVLVKNHSPINASSSTKNSEGGKKSAELLEAAIGYLLNVLKYDNERSVTETYFNSLMPALVNQLENEFCVEENLFDNLLIPCLANLAKCLNDDSLWKKFNYEILLKTQHENVKVRLAAVKTVCEVAKKLGDSYLPLLPESIPFLAELLEDEEEEVERTCRTVVQDMESVLGEQISKYFSK